MHIDRNWPKISIVTPSYNLDTFLEQAIVSVVSQGYPNLEYIIVDGGSTDTSIEIIKKYEKYLAYWVSEKDEGMYYALQKGFKHSTGEIMGWLNADDMLHTQSLFTIGQAFYDVPQMHWLQGYPTMFDELGRVVYMREPVASKFYFYAKMYHSGPFIQQESTFWRRGLWKKAGGFISCNYRYAGDFELWLRFFNHEKLYTVRVLVGGFRLWSEQQKSTYNANEYFKEADNVIEKIHFSFKEKVIVLIIHFVKYLSAATPFISQKGIVSSIIKKVDRHRSVTYNTVKKLFC